VKLKKNQLKKDKKNEPIQLKSTCQTRDPSHEIEITPNKANKKNYETDINNIELKNNLKNKQSQLG